MLRNREYRNMLIAIIVIITVGVITAFFLNSAAGIMILLSDSFLVAVFLYFTICRYRELKKLTIYLRQLSGGDYSLDIRDNSEGELSILKNEIYKVTQILSKQAELLKTEKGQLADAISDISHQLKTPLTSMRVMTDLLNNENIIPGKRKEFTKNLELQLNRMEWLLSSLLKLSKIDAGTVIFKKEEVRVTELIQRAIKPMLIPMELKEQNLILEGEESITFLGDLNWTTEAFINILKNCIEHTQIGGEIRISYDENPIYTEIIITDNGSGIEKKDLPFIFRRFYKGKNAGDDSVGIGLAMADSIISGQSGNISVISKEQQGTSFYVKFYKQIS